MNIRKKAHLGLMTLLIALLFQGCSGYGKIRANWNEKMTLGELVFNSLQKEVEDHEQEKEGNHHKAKAIRQEGEGTTQEGSEEDHTKETPTH